MSTVKRRIASAARTLFNSSGVEGVSMRKVADRVGVSATAIYRHYRDKGALLDAITEEGFAVCEGHLRRGANEADPIEAIRGVAHGLLDFALAEPELYEFLFILPRRNVRRFPDDLAQLRPGAFAVLQETVALGVARGRLAKDDTLELSLALWALGHGLISLHRAGRFGADARQFRKIYGRSLERLLVGIATRTRGVAPARGPKGIGGAS